MILPALVICLYCEYASAEVLADPIANLWICFHPLPVNMLDYETFVPAGANWLATLFFTMKRSQKGLANSLFYCLSWQFFQIFINLNMGLIVFIVLRLCNFTTSPPSTCTTPPQSMLKFYLLCIQFATFYVIVQLNITIIQA